MKYWLSDLFLVLSWWTAGGRPLNRAGKLGVSCWVVAAIFLAAAVCSLADSRNLLLAWGSAIIVALIIAAIGCIMIIVGAALEVARLRRKQP